MTSACRDSSASGNNSSNSITAQEARHTRRGQSAPARKLSLVIGLSFATLFHFANACLFGLNRFFWIWLAAYPSLLWLQQRVGAGL